MNAKREQIQCVLDEVVHERDVFSTLYAHISFTAEPLDTYYREMTAHHAKFSHNNLASLDAGKSLKSESLGSEAVSLGSP